MASAKKRRLCPAEIDQEVVGGRSIAEWERLFKPVQNGFNGDLRFASHRVGVLVVKYHGAVVYVGSGTAKNQGMLARLRQLAFGNSTGGHHYAARQIRKNLVEADLWLLLLARGELPIDDIRKISKLISSKYDPAWAAPTSVVAARIADSYERL